MWSGSTSHYKKQSGDGDLVTKLCPTLCNLMGPPVSSVHGISQARILQWIAISFSEGIECIFPILGVVQPYDPFSNRMRLK